MNEERKSCCYFHPREVVIGVCALCLNERLLVLASHQTHTHTHTPKPKIFALTNSLLNLLDIKQQHKPQDELFHTSSTSPEDSFISIKFEDNGAASWDKGKKISLMLNDQQQCEKTKSVVEQAKTRATLRWRKRIGHLFQVIRWKRSSKGNMCHVGTKLEGSKVKYGWIRNLIKRRTKE